MTEYFPSSESCCSCGCGFDIKPEVRIKFNAIRMLLKRPMIVSGPARCARQNAKTPGAAPSSRHMIGDAMDISTAGWSRYDTHRLVGMAIQCGAHGIGIYASWIHIDFRPGPLVIYWEGNSE